MIEHVFRSHEDILAHYGVDSWEGLERAIYKSTECGAWIHTTHSEFVVGSIVEGHPADVTPVVLTYPFSVERLDDAINEVESEARYMWHEANCHLETCETCGDCPGCDDACGCFTPHIDSPKEEV